MFRTLTIGDVLEGFMDNMSQEQIDEELKLFDRIGRELLGQDKDYTECGVVIDEDHMVDKDLFDRVTSVMGYRPWCEDNRASGFTFIYFKNLQDAEQAAEYIADYVKEQEVKDGII